MAPAGSTTLVAGGLRRYGRLVVSAVGRVVRGNRGAGQSHDAGRYHGGLGQVAAADHTPFGHHSHRVHLKNDRALVFPVAPRNRDRALARGPQHKIPMTKNNDNITMMTGNRPDGLLTGSRVHLHTLAPSETAGPPDWLQCSTDDRRHEQPEYDYAND